MAPPALKGPFTLIRKHREAHYPHRMPEAFGEGNTVKALRAKLLRQRGPEVPIPYLPASFLT